MICFDSWAVMAWLKGENPAHDIVEAVLENDRPTISWINMAEIYYLLARKAGERRAVDAINELRFALDCELPTERRILDAARIKTGNSVTLADCFAISVAADCGATLYTGDPEILEMADLPCEVRDLRG